MFVTDADVIASDLESVPAGPELAMVLASVDWDSLSGHDLIRVLRAQERQASYYRASALWSMNRIVEHYESVARQVEVDTGEAARGAAAEIGAALRLTRRSAEYEAALAMGLMRRLPLVWKDLLEGRIDVRRAGVIVGNTAHLSVGDAQVVAAMVLPDAGMLTTGQLAHRLRRLCADLNPRDAKERYESSLEDRRLVTEANPEGTANLLGLDLPPHVVEAIKRRINKEAIRLRNQGDGRTMDQLRADIFLDILSRRHGANGKRDLGCTSPRRCRLWQSWLTTPASWPVTGP